MLVRHRGHVEAHVAVDSGSVGGNSLWEPGLVAGYVELVIGAAHIEFEAVRQVFRASQAEVRQSDERLLEIDHETASRLVEET